MRYAICFDFPEAPGDPVFAGWAGNETPGLALQLENAIMFDDEETAERFLANSYGPKIRECGAIVEVATTERPAAGARPRRDRMTDQELQAVLDEVSSRLQWNKDAYGTAWNGEDEDTRFVCAPLLAVVRDQGGTA